MLWIIGEGRILVREGCSARLALHEPAHKRLTAEHWSIFMVWQFASPSSGLRHCFSDRPRDVELGLFRMQLLQTAAKHMTRGLLAVLVSLGLACSAWAQVDTDNPPNPPPSDRSVSWEELIPNILDDQKEIWTFPARVNHDHYWVPFLAVAAVTAGLVAADPWTDKPLTKTAAFHGFNSVFSSTATSAGIAIVPLSLYAVGLLRKDSYAANTALLAGEAVADSEVLATVLKTADRRVRPQNVSPNGNLSDSWFEANGGVGLGRGGFPSGHAIVAFSVATVMSRRYGNKHRWVPYVAYGLAAAVGFSRVTTLEHFPSDVFLGAALGYSVSRFAVLR
jgi:membrane-associated phospholipid phosphatase